MKTKKEIKERLDDCIKKEEEYKEYSKLIHESSFLSSTIRVQNLAVINILKWILE